MFIGGVIAVKPLDARSNRTINQAEKIKWCAKTPKFMNKLKYLIFLVMIVAFFMIGATIVRQGGWENLRPLPEGCLPKPINDSVLVIAAIPFAEDKTKGVSKPTWSEVEAALPILKEVGVDAIFLWAPYERAKPVDKITVYTCKGEMQLKLRGGLQAKNFLKPDPDRGSEDEFLHMIKKAHSLGIKVIPQLCILSSIPGDFIYEEHPEWILKSIYGKHAVMWPWVTTGAKASYGYAVNKAHPDLIKYVTEVIIPHWIEHWGADGIFLDAPNVAYCDLHMRDILKDMEEKGLLAEGLECLTPVDGYYSPEPLVKAMKAKIDELGEEMGRDLIFAGENTFKTWQDVSDDLIIKISKGNLTAFLTDPTMDRSQGKYFDWVWGYNFRSLLKGIYSGGEVSYSENYVKYFEIEHELDAKYTEIARFVNMWNVLMPFKDLLRPEFAGCYITLAVTALGKVVWIGVYQLPPQNIIIKEWNGKVLKEWYKGLISIKKGYPALQSKNIENALISPRIPRLIAYNRWDANTSVTVIVNAGNEHVTATIRTRFRGNSVRLIDLLSAETLCGKPESLRVEMPPRSARILVEYGK